MAKLNATFSNTVSDYQQQLIVWGKLPILTNILHVGKSICTHLLGMAYPGEAYYATSLIPIIFFISKEFRTKRVFILKALNILAPILIYTLPFFSIVLLGTDAGPRVYLLEPYSCALLWCGMLKNCKHHFFNHPTTHHAIVVLSVFLVLKAAYTVTDMAFTQHRWYEKQKRRAHEIIYTARSCDLPIKSNHHQAPIYVFGSYTPKEKKSDPYMSAIHGFSDTEIKFLPQELLQNPELQKQLREAPIFPHKGCCIFFKDSIIVKLEKET